MRVKAATYRKTEEKRRAAGKTMNEETNIRNKYARRPASDSRYSLLNPGHLFLTQDRERRVLDLLRTLDRPLKDLRILEIGSGDGFWLREFVKWGAKPENVTGLELLPERVSTSRRLCAPLVLTLQGSGAAIPFPVDSFDIVLQSTVFTSIQDAELRSKVANEMTRVLRPDGFILWYDFFVNNPANPDVTAVGSKEIRSLFRGCRVDLKRITLAPPITRRLAPLSWAGCQILSTVPALCAFYLGTIRRIL